MRLIDADALIAEYDRVHVGAPGGARKLMVDAPTIEPEQVHCKDCLMHGVCRFEQGLGLDGYCSKAERREDG